MFESGGRKVVACIVLALLGVTLAGSASSSPPASADPAVWLADLNAASDGSFAFVQISCFEFIPDIIEVQSGQTMHFLWDDLCQVAGHTVTSSGSTLDPAQDLDRPQPGFPANCFDSSLEPIGYILGPPPNDNYYLTLLYAGIVFRDVMESDLLASNIPPSDTQPACITDASFIFPEDMTATQDYRAVVPYWCRLHGKAEDHPAGEGMRGAIVLKL